MRFAEVQASAKGMHLTKHEDVLEERRRREMEREES